MSQTLSKEVLTSYITMFELARLKYGNLDAELNVEFDKATGLISVLSNQLESEQGSALNGKELEQPPVTWVDGGLIKDGLKDGTSLWYFSSPDALLSEYPSAQPMALYTSPLIKREPAPAPAPQTVRKVFVCVSCEGVYMDEPVSECDCMPEKNEFIESTLSYDMPV